MLRNKNGVTLVEVMVALVVFLFVSLALMQTALVSIEANMNSSLREEAVKIAEQRMNDARSLAFNSASDTLSTPSVNPCQDASLNYTQTGANDVSALSANNCPALTFRNSHATGWGCKRNVRSIANYSFCTSSTVTVDATSTYATITVSVGWNWKGNDYTHTVTTMRQKVKLI